MARNLQHRILVTPFLRYRWADDAFIWLASQDDVQMEQDQLAKAMQQSLEESEQLKASTKPLEECEDKELRERFEASSLLPKARPRTHC